MEQRIFSGKFDRDGFYTWLNPDLPREQRYARNHLLATFAEVDADTYHYFLAMLPPMYFTADGFAICEATTDDVRLGFFIIGGRYFAAHISDTDPAHKMAATRELLMEVL